MRLSRFVPISSHYQRTVFSVLSLEIDLWNVSGDVWLEISQDGSEWLQATTIQGQTIRFSGSSSITEISFSVQPGLWHYRLKTDGSCDYLFREGKNAESPVLTASFQEITIQGVKAITLASNDPRTNGTTAALNMFGVAPDGSRWIKTGVASTDWERIFISTNGEFAANVALAEVATDQVPDAGVLGRFNGLPTIGDGSTVRGKTIATSWPIQWRGFNPVTMLSGIETFAFTTGSITTEPNPALFTFQGLKAQGRYHLVGYLQITDGEVDGSFAGNITLNFSAAGYSIQNLSRATAGGVPSSTAPFNQGTGGNQNSAAGTSLTVGSSLGVTTNFPTFFFDVYLTPKADCDITIVLARTGPYPRTYTLNGNMQLTALYV